MDQAIRQRSARLTTLGFSMFGAERWKDAESCFRAAVVGNPDDEDAWIGLGSTLMKQHRPADAAIVFGLAAAVATSAGVWSTLLAADALLVAGDLARARQAMAWFGELAHAGAVTDEQAAVGRAVSEKLETES